MCSVLLKYTEYINKVENITKYTKYKSINIEEYKTTNFQLNKIKTFIQILIIFLIHFVL